MSRKLVYLTLGTAAVLLSACQSMEQNRRQSMGLPPDMSPNADVRTVLRQAPVSTREGELSAENLALQEARRDCAQRSLEPRTLNVQRETVAGRTRQGQSLERVRLHYVCERGQP